MQKIGAVLYRSDFLCRHTLYYTEGDGGLFVIILYVLILSAAAIISPRAFQAAQ